MMRNKSLINSVLWSDDDGNIILYKLTEMDIEKLKIRDSSGQGIDISRKFLNLIHT